MRSGNLWLGSLLLMAMAPGLWAANFESAEVTGVRNTVMIGELTEAGRVERPARVTDRIAGNQFLQTATKSRAEIKFNDDTLVRLGESSVFSFKAATREFFLNQGSCLIDVPKGRGETKISTAAITAAITGSVGLFQSFKNYEALYVYDGEFKTGRFTLRPGQVLIFKGGVFGEDGAFEVKAFDIRQAMTTSQLFKAFGSLPSQSLILAHADEQESGEQASGADDNDPAAVLNRDTGVRRDGGSQEPAHGLWKKE